MEAQLSPTNRLKEVDSRFALRVTLYKVLSHRAFFSPPFYFFYFSNHPPSYFSKKKTTFFLVREKLPAFSLLKVPAFRLPKLPPFSSAQSKLGFQASSPYIVTFARELVESSASDVRCGFLIDTCYAHKCVTMHEKINKFFSRLLLTLRVNCHLSDSRFE